MEKQKPFFKNLKQDKPKKKKGPNPTDDLIKGYNSAMALASHINKLSIQLKKDIYVRLNADGITIIKNPHDKKKFNSPKHRRWTSYRTIGTMLRATNQTTRKSIIISPKVRSDKTFTGLMLKCPSVDDSGNDIDMNNFEHRISLFVGTYVLLVLTDDNDFPLGYTLWEFDKLVNIGRVSRQVYESNRSAIMLNMTGLLPKIHNFWKSENKGFGFASSKNIVEALEEAIHLH